MIVCKEPEEITISAKLIHDACFAFRQDYGVLDYDERLQIRNDAQAWLRVWIQTLNLKGISL